MGLTLPRHVARLTQVLSLAPLLLAACATTGGRPDGVVAAAYRIPEPRQTNGHAEAPLVVIDPPESMPPAEAAFRRPTAGPVVEQGGALAGIAFRASGEVVAVKSGRVQLALASHAGRRNLLTLRHGDGFLSEYSDVDEILVPRGKAVRQGDPIARVTTPGGFLRFRLYREQQAVDPSIYFR